MLWNSLKKEFKKREPWVTKFIIKGKEYGGYYYAGGDKRLKWFFQYFPNTHTVLELGSLEGGHTFAIAESSSVDKVLGIEGRKENIEKATFVKDILKIQNVEFIEANLEDTDLSRFGTFDAVFCVGLLYHLPNPWELIEQISHLSRNLFLWTHYTESNKAVETVHGYSGSTHHEGGLHEPLSGLSTTAFWPTLDSLKKMLDEHGYKTIHIIEDNPTHQNGACVTLAAEILSNKDI